MKRRHFLSMSAAGAGAVLLARCSRVSMPSLTHEAQKVSQTSSQTSLPAVYTSTDDGRD